MKKTYISLFALSALVGISAKAQTIVNGSAAEKMISGSEIIRTNNNSKIPEYIQFRKGSEKEFSSFETWFHTAFSVPSNVGFKLLSTEKDKLGMLHYREQQTINGLPVEGSMYIVHTKNGKIMSVNGVAFEKYNAVADAPSLSEAGALQDALNYDKAVTYRWQVKEHEAQIKETTHNNDATWFPKAELVYVSPKGNTKATNYKLAYKFDVYAEKPLKRNYIYVDAVTGEIIKDENRIMDANTPATAYTVYSGHRPIMTDSYSGGYRLQETGRGLGANLMTYNNLQAANATGTTDFTNATTTWNDVDAALDQYATDAHWGAEKTYDFYDSVFGRNSIDNAGLGLVSYVHVDVNLVNAFWDGQEMNYGDGDASQGYTPLTSIDITGHEISHGLTQYTSALNGGAGTMEPGALNEGFSDCMGITIRHFAYNYPVIDWLIGDSIGTNAAFRDIANPSNSQNPDTYMGTNWDAAQQEVHQNSTVFSHCYYIVSMGESGTNDNNDTYSVTGIGINEAREIWFRANTVYFFPTTQYSDARTYCIQAAVDLFGGCSPEVIAVTNAWYAVGVGAAFVPVLPVCSFSASPASYCMLPATVTFTNTTTNGGNYTWYFGDGNTSSVTNPTHIYTSAQSFTVKLVTNGSCGLDSITNTNYITVNPLASPIASSPANINCGGIATLLATGDSLHWYNQPTGGTSLGTGSVFVTPALYSNATYYVQSVEATAPDYANPTTDGFGTGGEFTGTNSHYEVFDVTTPCTLVSVLVYATGAGNRTITLSNSSGTVLNTATVNIPNGTSRVTLNFPLSLGTGYRLACADGTSNLYRNATAAAYPYSDPNGWISITGNDVPDLIHYYYFYDWELQTAPCTSAAVPVVVNVSGGIVPSFTYTQSSNTFTFTNTTASSTSWHWNFGDGDTSNVQSPVYTYAANGNYTVTLTAYNGTCNDTVSEILNIVTTGIAAVSVSNSFAVYPNPANDNIMISFNIPESGKEYVIRVNNILGQTLASKRITSTSGSNQVELNLTDLTNGLYFIELQSNTEKIVRRVVKQ